jgi:hypothetical protein
VVFVLLEFLFDVARLPDSKFPESIEAPTRKLDVFGLSDQSLIDRHEGHESDRFGKVRVSESRVRAIERAWAGTDPA